MHTRISTAILRRLKRYTSLLLVLCISINLLPLEAWASETGDSSEPVLLTLTVRNSEGVVTSLLDGTVSLDLGEAYTFTATFSNSNQIQKVYITSTKGEVTRFLEAGWNGEAYVTAGYFDDNPGYIPGEIGVQYTKKTTSSDVDGDVDWKSLQKDLEDQCVVTMDSASDTAVTATVDVSELLKSEAKATIEFFADVFDETLDTDFNEWLGAYADLESLKKYVLDDENYSVYIDYSTPSTYAMILRDASKNRYVKMIFKNAGEYADTLAAVADKLETIELISSLSYNYLSIKESAETLREQVSASPMISAEEKQSVYQEIDDYEADKQLFALSMAILPVVMTATGGVMTGPTILFNALLGVINAASETFWDYRIGMITACEPIATDFIADSHGIPLTAQYLEAINYTITESGNYYLVNRVGTTIQIGTGDSGAVNVTLCEHGYRCTIVNNGSFLQISDCTYEEDVDGNMIAGEGNATVTNDGGYVTIASGQSWIDVKNNGCTTVNGGNVYKISVTGGGTTAVYGGTVKTIFHDSGSLLVGGCAKIYRIDNTSGTVDISNGTIGGSKNGTRYTLTNESGTVTIGGGTIVGYNSNYAIYNETNGTVCINGGEVTGGTSGEAAIINEGWMFIWGGTISTGDPTGCGCSIENDGGRVEIYSGRLIGVIENYNSGVMQIYGGNYQAQERANIANSWGTLEISGGTFEASGCSNILSAAGNINAEIETIIYDGEFYSRYGGCIVNDPTINHTSKSTITVYGGRFSAVTADYTRVGLHCVYNGSGCVMNIYGGTFSDVNTSCCVRNLGTLTIGGGVFTGQSGIEGTSCTFLIGENSSIEINAELYYVCDPDMEVLVEAEYGYDGGVNYYDAVDATGVRREISEASEFDFTAYTTQYVRLEADKTISGYSWEGVTARMTNSGDGFQTAKIFYIAGLLKAGITVFAATYTDGKLTDVASGTLQSDNTVTFSKPVGMDTVLFFLDDDYTPLCGKVILRE